MCRSLGTLSLVRLVFNAVFHWPQSIKPRSLAEKRGFFYPSARRALNLGLADHENKRREGSTMRGLCQGFVKDLKW